MGIFVQGLGIRVVEQEFFEVINVLLSLAKERTINGHGDLTTKTKNGKKITLFLI